MKRIVFRGELAPGVTRREALAALARLFPRHSPATLERELFRGRPVVLRRAPDARTAARYARALTRAGLVVEIEDASAPSTAPSAAPAPRRPRRRVPVAVAVLGALLLVLGGAGAWYSHPVWGADRASAAAQRFTRALATADLAALAHLDLARADALAARHLDADHLGRLVPEGGLFARLREAARAPQIRIDDALVGVGAGDDGGIGFAAVLLGRFDPAAVRQWIARHYAVEDTARGGTVLRLRAARPGCGRGRPLAARLHRDRVIVGSPAQVRRVTRRAGRGAAAGLDLATWRQRRAQELVSAAVFAPRALARAAADGRGWLQRLGRSDRALWTLYAGVRPRLVPPRLQLRLRATSDDDLWLRRTAQASRAARSRLAAATAAWPDAAAVAPRIAIAHGDAVTARLALGDAGDSLAPLAEAGVQALLDAGLAGPATARPGAAAGADEAGARAPGRVAAFGHWGNTAGFAWQGGPFGARIARTVADRERGHRIELDLRARELPWVTAGSPLVEAVIERVTDAGGEAVWRGADCDRAANTVRFDRPIQGMVARADGFERFDAVGAAASLRLAPGVQPAEVDRIEGRLIYRRPAEVVRRRTPVPARGERLEVAGVQLRLTRLGPRRIAYVAAGAHQRLLAVRALDRDGEPLAPRVRARAPRLSGPGSHVAAAYPARVAAVELVLAGGLDRHAHHLRLDDARPRMDRRTAGRARLPRWDTADALARARRLEPPAVDFAGYPPAHRTTSGPLLLALDGFRVNRAIGLYGAIGVYAPRALALARRLNAAEVALDGAVRPDGRVVDLDMTPQPVRLTHAGAHWADGRYRTDPDRPWLVGRTKLQVPRYRGPAPRAVVGHVTLRDARGVAARALSARLGTRWQGRGVTARVTQWAYDAAESTVTLALSGRAERVAAATAHDARGRRVDAATRIERRPDGGLRLHIDVSAAPAELRLYVARGVRERHESFRFDVVRRR